MKTKLIEGILIFAICLFFAFGIKYVKLSQIDTFTIGQTIEKHRTSKKFRSQYIFNCGGNYSGIYRSSFPPEKFKLNQFYLVGFKKKNPDVNYIFFDYPVAGNFNIDSLNLCCSPQDFLTWDDY